MSESKVGRPSHDERIKKVEKGIEDLKEYFEKEMWELAEAIEFVAKQLNKLRDVYKLRFPGDYARICPHCRKRVTEGAEECPNCERMLPV